ARRTRRPSLRPRPAPSRRGAPRRRCATATAGRGAPARDSRPASPKRSPAGSAPPSGLDRTRPADGRGGGAAIPRGAARAGHARRPPEVIQISSPAARSSSVVRPGAPTGGFRWAPPPAPRDGPPPPFSPRAPPPRRLVPVRPRELPRPGAASPSPRRLRRRVVARAARRRPARLAVRLLLRVRRLAPLDFRPPLRRVALRRLPVLRRLLRRLAMLTP